MHLDHKLPWSTLASHFKLVRMNKSYTPRRTNIFPTGKDNQEKELAYFQKTFCATLQEFSTTELLKIEAEGVSLNAGDALFSDEVLYFLERFYSLESYRENSLKSNPLSRDHQSLQYWIKRAGEAHSDYKAYTPSDGDLADALKGLIIISTVAPDQGVRSSASSAILRLERHPHVPLQMLDRLGWGHSFGLEILGGRTLDLYLLLNVADRLREQGSKIGTWELRSFLSYALDSLCDDDFPSHKIPHDAFFRQCGAEQSWVEQQRYKDESEGEVYATTGGPSDPLVDCREECQQYLRICFGMLYRYDMLRRLWYGDAEADELWVGDVNLILSTWGTKYS